jgi:hypothetical protein
VYTHRTGAGESGKSTILKQMRILHKDGFAQADFENIRPVVYSNTIHCMLAILRAMYTLNVDFHHPDRQVRAAPRVTRT